MMPRGPVHRLFHASKRVSSQPLTDNSSFQLAARRPSMNDVPPGTPDATTPSASDEQKAVSPLRFLAQFIKDLSFEVPHAPEVFNILRNQAPQMDMVIDTGVRQVEGTVFEVMMQVSITATAGEKTAFILELVFNSIVELNPDVVPQEQAHPVLLIEVPRHMFPFVRQIVANMTSSGGFPPVLMQLVDFGEMYRRKFSADEEAGAPAAEPPPSVH